MGKDEPSAGLEQGPQDSHPHTIGRNACQRAVQAALLLHVPARILNRALGRFRHVLQLQIFHGHPSVFLCDGVSRSLHEVLTNVADTTIVRQNLVLQLPAPATRLPFVKRGRLAQIGQLLAGFLVVAKLLLKNGNSFLVLLDG